MSAGAPPRALHLVDVDNLIGDPRRADRDTIEHTLAAYAVLAGVGGIDHVVLATNPYLAADVGLAWPRGRRLVVRRGRNGADLALLAELDEAIAHRRFVRVVIGGGDHIYTAGVVRLVAAGIEAVVVARRGFLSRRLRDVSADVRLLAA